MALDVGAISYVLNRMLQEIVAAAEASGVTLPDRQYVTTGGAVYDCEQVTVSANSIATGLAGTQEGGVNPVGACEPGWNVSLELAVVRGASEAMQGRRGTIAPSVADIQADTALASSDAAILTQAVAAIAGSDWDSYGSVPASIQFGEVGGGMTAVVLTVTLNVWTFPPTP